MHKNGVRKRRRYERTTPIGRLAKNVGKAASILQICKLRLASWGAFAPMLSQDASSRLVAAGARVLRAIVAVDEASTDIEVLLKKGFSPPRRSSAVVFQEGDSVRIADKYREKYLLVYDQKIVDELKVHKVLETGELSVARGRSAPFIVVKSHVVKRREDEGKS